MAASTIAPGHPAWKEPAACGDPELRGNTRALQNCCGSSGVHGLFILWRSSARFEGGRLWVHMHLDKALPGAEIRCLQPWQGLLSIRLGKPFEIRVRIPEFARFPDVRVCSGGVAVEPRRRGNYLEVDGRRAGETIEVRYPLPTVTDEETVGNPGFRQYRYRVTWKGDTVVRMEPLGNDWRTGYSDFEKEKVPVFYGTEGPGPLYRREHMLDDAAPEPSPLHEDDGAIDFWHALAR